MYFIVLLEFKNQNNEEKASEYSLYFRKTLSKESGDKSNPTPSSISSLDEEKENEPNSTFKIRNPINEGRLNSIVVLNIPQHPRKRRRMSQFHPSDRDIVRRGYCSKDLCQPYIHE